VDKRLNKSKQNNKLNVQNYNQNNNEQQDKTIFQEDKENKKYSYEMKDDYTQLEIEFEEDEN
jgi:hypothetical protein